MRRRVVLAISVLALLALAGPAQAHALLVRSEPTDGEVLDEPPSEIRLWFSEEIAAELSRASLVDAAGKEVAALAVNAVPGQPGLLVLTVPDVPAGLYGLAWKVLSEGDAHYREGLLVYRFGPGSTPVAPQVREESETSLFEAALRWLELAGLVVVTGAAGVALLVLSDPGARRRVMTVGGIATAITLIAGLGLLFERAGVTHVSELVGATRWGRLWLAQMAVVIVLGLVLLSSRNTTRRQLVMAVPLVLALNTVHALAGHAPGTNSLLAMGAATVHLLTAGIWVGGIVALLFAWRSGRGWYALARTSLMRFGRLASAGVALITVSGLYYASQEVASLDALITTLYGRTLLAKTGLFLGAGALGLLTALVIRHPRDAPRLRDRLVAETAFGLLVLSAAGLLGATPPARGPEFVPSSPSTRTQTVDDLLVTVSAKPNLAGPNLFEVLVSSTRRPPAGDIEGVRLRFSGAPDGRSVTSPPLSLVSEGRYRISGRFLAAEGAFTVAALIERAGIGESVVEFDWSIGGTGEVVVSAAPLEPMLTRVALIVLIALTVSAIWMAPRRGRPMRPGGGPGVSLGRPREQMP